MKKLPIHLTNGVNMILHCDHHSDHESKGLFVDPMILITESARGPHVLPGGQVEYEIQDHESHDGTEIVEPYLTACLRETREEVGIAIIDTLHIDQISNLQQRAFLFDETGVKTGIVVGTVLLYAYDSIWPYPLDHLKLDPNEVASVEYIRLSKALSDTRIGLAYRRMLVTFVWWLVDTKKHADAHAENIRSGNISANGHIRRVRPFEANLGSKLKCQIGPDTFEV